MRRALATAGLALLALACSEPPTQATRPQLELTAPQVDFGDVAVLNLVSKPFEVRNAGRAPLTLEAAEIREAGAAFAVRSAPTTIGAGEGGDVVLAFVPARLEAYAATLILRSDDPDRPVVEVPLAGRGFTVATMEADPGADFGVVCEGAEAIRSFAIRSTGTADLLVEDLRFAEGTAPEFQFVSSTRTPAVVPMGGEITLTVRVSTTEASATDLAGAVLISGTDPARRTVAVPLTARVNRAPRAAIAEVANAAPGATVDLDGSASSDPDGDDPLSYLWALKSSPLGSRAQPAPTDESTTRLALDLPGQYTVGLTVTDAQGCVGRTAWREVLAKPAQQLLVELVWDNLDPDLDLHMVPESGEFFGPDDCFFQEGHTSPAWGATLDRDALTGYGPEIIGVAEPAAGRYEVMVDYYSDHRSKKPSTVATVRVYEFGVVKAEQRRTLQVEGRRWYALTIDWPSGAITPVDVLQ